MFYFHVLELTIWLLERGDSNRVQKDNKLSCKVLSTIRNDKYYFVLYKWDKEFGRRLNSGPS